VTSSAVCDRESCLPSAPSWLRTGRNWFGGTFSVIVALDAPFCPGSLEVCSAKTSPSTPVVKLSARDTAVATLRTRTVISPR